ncbi:sigma 54-interacting transcriptional regulator [Xanthobacter agilis]|uniref:Nif-specific regulatory protein n=1 Tax=Xanthobacter agilis TaxID=47492 RepID=A0ABU0LDG4_XANAG|nr:sigma 54-interacting transcriptional regulator [Xanthobacter agilis]MDQ0505123.1 Nif-specific regulatory protein [Xanthobacter agilis]
MNVMSPPSEAIPLPPGDADVALSGVCEIAEILAEPQPPACAIGAALGVLSRFCGLDHGLVCIVDDTGAPRPLAAGAGEASAAAERAGGAFLAEIADTALPSVARTPGCAGGDKEVRIGVPIKEAGRVVGTLSVERLRRSGMAGSCDEDLRVLTVVASLVAAALRVAPPPKELAPPVETPPGAPPRPRDLGIVGSSAALGAALDKVARVAGSALAVLLRGESGTGKELFAQAVHHLSPRRAGPFVKVNCAALPETMLESELFGHEKGAFTGALAARKGRFELADGGTLFLDEIGDISAGFQAKLLRVLQEGEFERVGGTRTLKVDVRIVAATNRDLETAVAMGVFRADLYYRLGVVPILLPALRDRPGDIPVLARHVLQRFNAENHTRLKLGASALEVVRACAFPGNVRELENCIRRTAILAQGPQIEATDFACRGEGCPAGLLARHLRVASRGQRRFAAGEGRSRSLYREDTGCPPEDDVLTGAERLSSCSPFDMPDPAADARTVEMSGRGVARRSAARVHIPRLPDAEMLLDAMETAGWVQAKAARLLNLTPRQVAYALNRHGIDVKKF